MRLGTQSDNTRTVIYLAHKSSTGAGLNGEGSEAHLCSMLHQLGQLGVWWERNWAISFKMAHLRGWQVGAGWRPGTSLPLSMDLPCGLLCRLLELLHSMVAGFQD